MTYSSSAVVVDCYRVFERFFPSCGFLDMTEGIYDGNPRLSYEEAQRRQIDYLLDQAGCGPGRRVLDLGCGNGTLLKRAQERGARATGITISPEQVDRCRAAKLDVHLLNYREMDGAWRHRFDAIVANGSAEHFVQPEDARAGRADALYRELFEICHRAIDPASPVRRLVTTIIHFVRPVPAEVMCGSPWRQRPFSDAFHYAMLARAFGGYYPQGDQLARCASGYFRLGSQVDGTHDYHLTSEHWLAQMRRQLRGRQGLSVFGRALPFLVRHPRAFGRLFTSTLLTQSWNWQFRGPSPPTQLLRQTWEYCAA